MIKVPFVPSFKLHFFVGLFTSLWLVFFLIFIGPFDIGELPMKARFELLPGYGLVCLFSYLIVMPLQFSWYKKRNDWNLSLELISVLAFSLLCFGLSYMYYKTDWVNGNFSFVQFSFQIFLPTLIISLPILVGLRWAVTKVVVARAKKNELSSSELIQWKKNIDQLVKNKVFLDSGVTLQDTASRLQTNTTMVSRVINQGYGLNFNDFVNRIKLEEVLNKIEAGEHKKLTLSALAETCGFNSKSTFNRAFKKFMNENPSDYVKRHS